MTTNGNVTPAAKKTTITSFITVPSAIVGTPPTQTSAATTLAKAPVHGKWNPVTTASRSPPQTMYHAAVRTAVSKLTTLRHNPRQTPIVTGAQLHARPTCLSRSILAVHTVGAASASISARWKTAQGCPFIATHGSARQHSLLSQRGLVKSTTKTISLVVPWRAQTCTLIDTSTTLRNSRNLMT